MCTPNKTSRNYKKKIVNANVNFIIATVMKIGAQ